MEKPNIRIIDNVFAHSNGGSFGSGDLNIMPENFSWHRGEQIDNVVIITETCAHLVDKQNENIKILLVLEPPCINPSIYEQLKDDSFISKFDYILTHDTALSQTNNKFICYPFGGCWIRPQERKIYPKTKGISIISSNKNQTIGHRLRHEVIEKYSKEYNIDVFGRGYTPIENKITALADYKFSIVIENESRRGWFTEKLIDCIQTGTIPIYYGDPSTLYPLSPYSNGSTLFGTHGILTFSNLHDLLHLCLIPIQREEIKYEDRILTIKNNFNTSKQYCLPEDWIWNNFLGKIYGQCK